MKCIVAIMLVLLLPVVVQAQEKLHITGNIEGISDSIKMVLSSGKQQQEFYLKDGKIDVSMALQEAPNFVQLIAYTGNNPKYAFFFLDNESVEINGAIDNFSDKLRAMNSPHDSLRYENKSEINHLIKERAIYVDEFYKLLAEGKDRDSVAEVYLSEQQPFGKI
ncbi:hypothetical protein [Myroides injenensis]|uniref:hypothetical protein n=1 Tax=Myroides injenensis TaxID=1183151 RepID=UPI00030BFA53|nr:hypothetical protein [Myroides injenensis]